MNNNRLPFYPPVDQKISFSDRETALMKRMQGTPLPAPANGSKEFQAVILKACEYLPENRYESMHELYNVLQKLGKTPREIPDMPEILQMQENGLQETGRGKDTISKSENSSSAGSGKKKLVLAAGLVLALGIGGFAVHYGMEYSKTYEVTVENDTEKGNENSKTYEVTVENDTEKENNGGIYQKKTRIPKPTR